MVSPPGMSHPQIASFGAVNQDGSVGSRSKYHGVAAPKALSWNHLCSHTAQRSVSRPSLRVSVGCIGVHVRACLLFKRDGRAWGRGTWLARASLCFGMRFGDRSLTRNACACERGH